MWEEVVCAFSVEEAQVVLVTLEKVSFERLLCRLVMPLLRSEATQFYLRCSEEMKGGEPGSTSLGLVCCLLVSRLARW